MGYIDALQFGAVLTYPQAYIAAWYLDLLVPLFLGVLITVTCSETYRDILFPPAPVALVDISKGTLKEPQAKQLGTINTLTGAPEKHEGEAVEQEAANFADNIRHIMTRSIGMHENHHEGGDPLEGKVPKPVRNAVRKVQAQGQAAGHTQEEADPVQQPMEDMLWDKVKPEKLDPMLKNIPHVLGEIADNYERVAKYVSSSRPYPLSGCNLLTRTPAPLALPRRFPLMDIYDSLSFLLLCF